MVNIKNISTESRNNNTYDIDQVSTQEILVKLNNCLAGHTTFFKFYKNFYN